MTLVRPTTMMVCNDDDGQHVSRVCSTTHMMFGNNNGLRTSTLLGRLEKKVYMYTKSRHMLRFGPNCGPSISI